MLFGLLIALRDPCDYESGQPRPRECAREMYLRGLHSERNARDSLVLNSSIGVGSTSSAVCGYKVNQDSLFGFHLLFLFHPHRLCSPPLPSGGIHLLPSLHSLLRLFFVDFDGPLVRRRHQVGNEESDFWLLSWLPELSSPPMVHVGSSSYLFSASVVGCGSTSVGCGKRCSHPASLTSLL